MYNLQKQLEEFISHTEETNRQDQGCDDHHERSIAVLRGSDSEHLWVGLFYTLSRNDSQGKKKYKWYIFRKVYAVYYVKEEDNDPRF